MTSIGRTLANGTVITAAVSEEEIMAKCTPKSLASGNPAWTAKQLAEWGVPWPPPGGWKDALIANYNKGSVPRVTAPDLYQRAREAAAASLAPGSAANPSHSFVRREPIDTLMHPLLEGVELDGQFNLNAFLDAFLNELLKTHEIVPR